MNRTARTLSITGATAGLLLAAACGNDTQSTPATTAAAPAHPADYVQVRSAVPAAAAQFTVTSPDGPSGGTFPADGFAAAFGCTAANHAPRLHWSGAPATAKSFAVTMFDPDAPSGAGFWHWMEWDIPATATDFTEGSPAVAGANDAGATGYVGPCPPSGDKAHNYQITVLALDTPSLGLPATTSPTVTSFSMNSHIIAYGRLTLTAQRP
ncbi:YbhB/YbcL family Raf kinase inhibitor-like protein [Nocardia sp. NBC_01388]|uniref:YbhB/YbcL family Raf kinase inhibitor-like protein n=1 Tax=Nocardia sp. NBC_01388 TaxID=2903596 RepID=UPI00324EB08A